MSSVEKKTKSMSGYLLPGIVLYLLFPIVYMLLGDFPSRTFLKETLSILTIAAFFLMQAQFYFARSNKPILKGHKMAKVIKIHKAIGYIFIPVLMLHPFFIVLPRFFESGVDPIEAFITLLTTWNSNGIIMGLIAWVLMVILGITSMFRNKIEMKYTSWRYFHGLLSIVFIILATWHAVDLGKHTDTVMSTYMILLGVFGIILLMKIYFMPIKKEQN